MQGVRYVDERNYEYRVLPVVWIWGYRTFKRYCRHKWRIVDFLPLRHTEPDAEADLVKYAEGKGWIRC
jgi:hypothetical protein